MAQNFNYKSRTARVQVNNSQNIPTISQPSLQNNVFLYGNRRALKSGETFLPIPQPQPGYPVYTYYQTYQLQSNLVTDANSLANWFLNCGYQVSYGLSGPLNVNNIAGVLPIASNSVILYFNSQLYNTSQLANNNISGNVTLTNGTTNITGNLVSVKNGKFSVTTNTPFSGNCAAIAVSATTATISSIPAIVGQYLAVGTNVTFTVGGTTFTSVPIATTTGTSITVTLGSQSPTTAISAGAISAAMALVSQSGCDTQIVINNLSATTGLTLGFNLTGSYVVASSDVDPNNTEPFVYNLWMAARALNKMGNLNANATLGAPAIYFSILPDRASTNPFGPAGTGVLPLGTCGNVSTGTSVVVSIPQTNTNVSFVPSLALGNSTLTQGSGVSGVVVGWIFNGNNIDVQLNSVTGTFASNTATTLNLDTTVTFMSIRNKYFASSKISLRIQPCIYEISTVQQFNANQAIFTDTINLNAPELANVNQGNCSIVFGTINLNGNVPPLLAPTVLPSGETINNQFFEPFYFNYVYRTGIRQMTTEAFLCAAAAVMAANNYPFNPLNDILFDGVTNSPYPSDWIDNTPDGAGDTIVNLGYNVIFSTNQAQQYLNLGVTGITTVDNLPDNEFYPSYIVDVKDYNRKQVYLICQENGVGQVRQTPTTLVKLHNAIKNLLNQQATDGIIPLNIVQSLISQIIVRRSPQNPLGVYIYYPLVQNPAFLNAYVEIDNYSVNATF